VSDDPGLERVKGAVFDLTQVSAATRTAVAGLLTATLTAEEIDDQDIKIYVGCTRADLVQCASQWSDAATMSLYNAEIVWLVLSSATTIVPWRRWVPNMPAEDVLEAASSELYEPIHHRVVRLSNDW
jgi:hypothetical protein